MPMSLPVLSTAALTFMAPQIESRATMRHVKMLGVAGNVDRHLTAKVLHDA
jgi:hypothetical protein